MHFDSFQHNGGASLCHLIYENIIFIVTLIPFQEVDNLKLQKIHDSVLYRNQYALVKE